MSESWGGGGGFPQAIIEPRLKILEDKIKQTHIQTDDCICIDTASLFKATPKCVKKKKTQSNLIPAPRGK